MLNILTYLAVILLALLFPISGKDASKHEIDIGFTCTVYIDDKASCTGTLISRMWAITTCLCIQNIPSSRLMVRIGDPYLHGESKSKFYQAVQVEIHPECITISNEYRAENDISMIMLHEPFFDSKHVFISKLPNQLMYWTPDTDEELELASYTDLQNKANKLEEAVWQTKTSIVRPSVCEEKLKTRNFKMNLNTCANYWHKDGHDKCDLDQGTPLVYQFILIGILVHKNDCGKEGDVASFVNIPMHSQWIRNMCAKHTPWILLK